MEFRRFALALVVCLIGGLTLSASAQTVVVWSQSDVRHEQFVEIVEWYKQENPGIDVTVELIPGGQDEFTEKLILAIASGAPPDLTWLEGSTVIELAAQGLLTDATRTLEGIRFTPADTEEMTFDGKMWAVPYHTTSRGLFKRTDLFQEAGLDHQANPADLDELWDWSQKLTDSNNDGTYDRVGFIPWGTNWGAPAWIWTFGGQLLDESLRPTATHPNNIRAFEWLQEWGQSYGGTSPVPGGPNGFINGTIAMLADSTTTAGRFLDQGVEFTTGRVPHPPGGQNGTWGGGQALGVPYNATNKDEALKLLRYFGEEKTQVRRFERFPEAFPANWDALQTIVPTLPDAYASLLDQLPEARPRTPLWIDYYVRNLRPAEAAVVAGNQTPHQALSNVQQVMEERFAQLFGTR